MCKRGREPHIQCHWFTSGVMMYTTLFFLISIFFYQCDKLLLDTFVLVKKNRTQTIELNNKYVDIFIKIKLIVLNALLVYQNGILFFYIISSIYVGFCDLNNVFTIEFKLEWHDFSQLQISILDFKIFGHVWYSNAWASHEHEFDLFVTIIIMRC